MALTWWQHLNIWKMPSKQNGCDRYDSPSSHTVEALSTCCIKRTKVDLFNTTFVHLCSWPNLFCCSPTYHEAVQNGALSESASPFVLWICLNTYGFKKFVCLLRTVRSYEIYFFPHKFVTTFRVRHSWGEMYSSPVCVSVCLTLASFPHYCTNPDVTWGNGRGCPLVVHYWADLQSVHGFRCYDHIALNAKCQWVLELALGLGNFCFAQKQGTFLCAKMKKLAPVIMLGMKSLWPGASSRLITLDGISKRVCATSIVTPRDLPATQSHHHRHRNAVRYSP